MCSGSGNGTGATRRWRPCWAPAAHPTACLLSPPRRPPLLLHRWPSSGPHGSATPAAQQPAAAAPRRWPPWPGGPAAARRRRPRRRPCSQPFLATRCVSGSTYQSYDDARQGAPLVSPAALACRWCADCRCLPPCLAPQIPGALSHPEVAEAARQVAAMEHLIAAWGTKVGGEGEEDGWDGAASAAAAPTPCVMNALLRAVFLPGLCPPRLSAPLSPLQSLPSTDLVVQYLHLKVRGGCDSMANCVVPATNIAPCSVVGNARGAGGGGVGGGPKPRAISHRPRLLPPLYRRLSWRRACASSPSACPDCRWHTASVLARSRAVQRGTARVSPPWALPPGASARAACAHTLLLLEPSPALVPTALAACVPIIASINETFLFPTQIRPVPSGGSWVARTPLAQASPPSSQTNPEPARPPPCCCAPLLPHLLKPSVGFL